MDTENQELDERFIKNVRLALIDELARLRCCGAVDEYTALNDVYSVALHNLANSYSNRKSKAAKNLLKF